jgi:hypothetical protein
MQTSLTESGRMIPGFGFAPNRHDALTGSQPDGRAFPAGEDRTCGNWTSSTQGSAMLGHIDRRPFQRCRATLMEFVASFART